MSHFITIAGPQSSGKTTALRYLQEKHKNWYFVEEINPYTVAGANHPGGAYVDKDLETNIVKMELAKIEAIKNKTDQTIAVETGIGHVVYTQYFAGKKIADKFYDDYIKLYNNFNPLVIFIDTVPEISFDRRRRKYEERITKRGITDQKEFKKALKKYKDTVLTLYPLWMRFYEKFPFQKVKIKNDSLTRDQFLKEIDQIILFLLSRQSSR